MIYIKEISSKNKEGHPPPKKNKKKQDLSSWNNIFKKMRVHLYYFISNNRNKNAKDHPEKSVIIKV